MICLTIAAYQKQIIGLLSTVIPTSVPFPPEICLLGLLDEEQGPIYTRMLLRETLFFAHKLIALKWIGLPFLTLSVVVCNQVIRYEKVIYENRG